MKKVAISACLLGEFCRYDGKTKIHNSVITAFEGWEIIPFCPEAPLFGTPRERISIFHVSSRNEIITDETNKNVTKLLIDETKKFISAHPDLNMIVLKSKSPSCGLGTTPILNEKREIITLGDGISAALFKENYSHLQIKDETYF
ncbi:MAG: DUF523 domain-containing protein [Thiovulaceae bacterium]|nr:DUF523 domain-containing protein [Sulfurimonadaceae bacterium]